MALAQLYNLYTQKVSDTANVAASGTFTSTQQTCSNAGAIVGTIFADQAGTLFVDQSSDGTNYDTVTSQATTASSTAAGSSFSVAVVAPYFRIRWTNGSGVSATTVKRLYAGTRSV